MTLRSPTDYEIGRSSVTQAPVLDLSFPRRRESRFVQRQISLDTRFRGYDEPPGYLFNWLEIIPVQVFSKEITKDTKVSDDYVPNFVTFVSFVVKRPFCFDDRSVE